jgi:hypothetical protein
VQPERVQAEPGLRIEVVPADRRPEEETPEPAEAKVSLVPTESSVARTGSEAQLAALGRRRRSQLVSVLPLAEALTGLQQRDVPVQPLAVRAVQHGARRAVV